MSFEISDFSIPSLGLILIFISLFFDFFIPYFLFFIFGDGVVGET